MGDVDRGRGDALAQALELDPHLGAQLGVEVGERLVEQEHLRVAHDAAAERDALLLAAGQLARLAVEQFADPEDLHRALDLLADAGLGHLPIAQPEGEIVVDAHVLVERVVLEHHRDVAVLGRQVVDHALADRDGAGADLLEPGDHAQRRRLAAARWPDQHHELLVLDHEVDVAHRGDRAIALADACERHPRHRTLSPPG